MRNHHQTCLNLPLDIISERIAIVKPFDSSIVQKELLVPLEDSSLAIRTTTTPLTKASLTHSRLDMGCLCGCNSDNVQCLRPNRPPSPNTFYEVFWAPNFTCMLQTRLEAAARNLEPSKRIWWREEFGGCAPDRKPLESEICNKEAEDLGKVLKTSPPILTDDFYSHRKKSEIRAPSSRMRDRSSNPLDTPISKRDEAGKMTIQNFTYEREIQWLCQKPLRHSSNRVPNDSLPRKSPSHHILNKSPPFKYSPQRQLRGTQRKSPRDDYPKRIRSEWNCSPPLIAAVRSHLEDRRESDFREPFVRPKAGSPKSPTHHVPNKLPPLKIPEFTKEHPARRALRTGKKTTAEQDRKLLHEDLQWLKDRGFQIPEAVRAKAQFPKSPTQFTVDEAPPLRFPVPDLATMNVSRRKPRVYTAEEDEQLLQSALRKREVNNLERQRLVGMPLNQSGLFPAESSNPIAQSDRFEQVPTSTPLQDNVSKPEGHQQVKQPPMDDYLTRVQQDLNYSPPLAVRPKFRSPKSPTHYNPDRPPPLKIPDFSTEHPARRPLRMEKKPIVEDDDQILPPDHPSWLKVMRLAEVMKAERLRREELKIKIEAMKLRRSQRRGITIHRSENASSASPHPVSHVDPVEEELYVFPAAGKLRQLEPLLLEKIEALRLRRSRRQGTAIHRSENASCASSHFVPHVDPVEEELSVAEMSPAPEGLRLLKSSLLERIQAMRLRRGRRHGTAIHWSEASVSMGSDSSSRHVEVRQVSSKIEPQPRSSDASSQQLEPSLWKKVGALKQRLSRRQGIAIYRAEELNDQELVPPSKVNQTTGVLLGTQIHKQDLMLDRPPRFRVHSCQDFAPDRLGRSSRQGTARSV